MPTFSTKREIRHFHVVVVQRRQRNVQKSVMHVQSYCFANRSKPIAFFPFSLPSPSSLLKLPNESMEYTLCRSIVWSCHCINQRTGDTEQLDLCCVEEENTKNIHARGNKLKNMKNVNEKRMLFENSPTSPPITYIMVRF